MRRSEASHSTRGAAEPGKNSPEAAREPTKGRGRALGVSRLFHHSVLLYRALGDRADGIG